MSACFDEVKYGRGVWVPGFGIRDLGFRESCFVCVQSGLEIDLGRAAVGRHAQLRGLGRCRRPCLVANRTTLPQKWPPAPPGMWPIRVN